MPSQIIRLPDDVFEAIYAHTSELRNALLPHRLDVIGCHGDVSGSIEISLTGQNLSRASRHDACIPVMSIIPRQATGPCPYFRPRPLEAAEAARLLDLIQDALLSLPLGVSAHDLMGVSSAIEDARQATPIGRRPIMAFPVSSERQSTLLRKAHELCDRHSSNLRSLDRKLASYQADAEALDVDYPMARLSAHSEIARGLALRLREGSYPVAELVRASRRGSLAHSLEAAQNLELAYDLAHSRMDPCCLADSWPTLHLLDCLHRQIVGLPLPTAQGGKAYAAPSIGQLPGARPTLGAVPTTAIHQAIGDWLDDMHPGRWTKVHSLVWASIAFGEFLGIRPFESGNGRMARLLFAQSLVIVGLPVLPFEAALESLRTEYASVVEATAETVNHDQIVGLMLIACELAIKQASAMAPVIAAERDKLKDILVAWSVGDDRSKAILACLLAEDLVSAVLVEGFLPRQHLIEPRQSRKMLAELAAAGLLERVSTPHGTWLSVPAIRELMKQDFS